MALQAPKGTKDVLPGESYRWQYLEAAIRSIAAKYGFLEVRTPVFEHTEVFLRGIGDTTDVVQKEMYTFEDKGGRSVTLKPEGTAGVVRMFIENALFNEPQPVKAYYLSTPVFRYERPQAGRLREHHQFGIELFGSPLPTADAECILLALELFGTLGCTSLTVCLNNIGCPVCRKTYQSALREYLADNYDALCDTCKMRYEKNPLRILDCKTPFCGEIARGAPLITDYVCDDCKAHFGALTGLLDALNVSYRVVPTLVRGLDYYTRTVFEIVSDCIGAQGTVCGGGRYDNLVEQLGGPKTPAVGFGLGMERLLLLLDQLGRTVPALKPCDLYIASIGAEAAKQAFLLAHELRGRGAFVLTDQVGRSAKAQFKYADKLGARNVLTIGDTELADKKANIKRLADGRETPVALDADTVYKAILEE